MQVRFTSLASHELADARAWLENQQPGLGNRLNDDVRHTIERIQRMPLMYPVDTGDIRKATLARFPYTLRYALRAELILIVAVSHHHRAPDYWVGG
ncbi:Plasmid stabilization system protein [compost metagenome]